MENENESKEQVGPYKKSKVIVISRTLLKKIAIGLLILICVFLVITYLNSGLTHNKAKEVFIDYWNKTHGDGIEKLVILGMKKIKKDTYLVKIQFTYLSVDYDSLFEKESEPIVSQEEKDIRRRTFEEDEYVFTKWDTGWFIEEKKK